MFSYTYKLSYISSSSLSSLNCYVFIFSVFYTFCYYEDLTQMYIVRAKNRYTRICYYLCLYCYHAANIVQLPTFHPVLNVFWEGFIPITTTCIHFVRSDLIENIGYLKKKITLFYPAIQLLKIYPSKELVIKCGINFKNRFPAYRNNHKWIYIYFPFSLCSYSIVYHKYYTEKKSYRVNVNDTFIYEKENKIKINKFVTKSEIVCFINTSGFRENITKPSNRATENGSYGENTTWKLFTSILSTMIHSLIVCAV